MNDASASPPPVISIIVPVYNGAGEIGATLESVGRQTLAGTETIVVNDASTDDTQAICEKYPVTLVNLEENKGPAFARNIGVSQAKGEIILFIDTGVVLDDPETLSNLARKFEERPDIAGVIMVRSGTPRNKGITPRFWAMMNEFEWLRAEEFHTSFATERSAIRASVLKKMDLFVAEYKGADVEDHEFGFRLHEQGHKILVARDIVVSDSFDTLAQATRKMLRRSYYWFRLFIRRRKFDTVWNTEDRAHKTLLGGICLPLLPIAFLHPLLLAAEVIVFSGYMVYSSRFHMWTVFKAKKPHLVFPFMILDLYFSTIILIGASWSLLTLLARPSAFRT